jgi:hypothetical protein
MPSKALRDRLERLEKQKQTAYKPVVLLFGVFAVYAVAGKAGKRAKGTVLERYAKACRYRSGVAELLAVARDNPELFAKKHLRTDVPWREPAHVEDARAAILAAAEADGKPVAPYARGARLDVDRWIDHSNRVAERMKEAEALKAA